MTIQRATYSELLRHPSWQEKRLRIMERAGFKCERCGDKETTLNVHHCFYTKGAKPWEYEDVDLLCLCEPCHESATTAKASLDRRVGSLHPSLLYHLEGFAQMLRIASRRDDDTPIDVLAGFASYPLSYLALGWRHNRELCELESRVRAFDKITPKQLSRLERETRPATESARSRAADCRM